jgi:hypothetical protein
MSPAPHTTDGIDVAASYACVQLLPPSAREAFVRDLRVKYRAEPVVYVLQALSQGMAAIFFGLLTNYLYDKTKFKTRTRRLAGLKTALRHQRTELRKLKRQIDEGVVKPPVGGVKRRYAAYDKVLTQIETDDPEIVGAVKDAIRQLEKRGSNKLKQSVNRHFP